MIKLIEYIKKVFTIKFLLFITAFALIVISVSLTLQSIKKNKIENLALLEKNKEKKILDSISKPKKWEIDSVYKVEMNLKSIQLRTKYNNGKLFYEFTIYTKVNNDKYFLNFDDETIIIDFNDKDKFKLYSLELLFSDCTHTVKDGNRIGYYWEGNIDINKDFYYSFNYSSLRWNFY
jgi:hypothetical protein